MEHKTVEIEQTVFVPAVPAEVYEAFLDEEEHAAFTGAGATCDRRVGGKFSAWDGYISGKNLVLEEGRRIVQEWITTEWPEGHPPSVVEFTFSAKKGGTELRMVHSKVPEEQAESYRQGWIDFYWEPLKTYFKKRSGVRKG